MRLEKGCVIEGRWNRRAYEILKKLGEGGLGAVFLTRCMDDGQKYAIKVFDNLMSAAREYRLFKEFSYMEYIPRVYELDDMLSYQASFIVMEYIQGDNLRDFLKGCVLEAKSIIGLSVVFLRLFKEFHKKGYVFADIKPENIMVDREKKLLRFVDVGGLTKMGSGVVEYTPWYDRASWGCGLRRADETYDLFGIGIILLELLYGKRHPPDKKALKKLLLGAKNRSSGLFYIIQMCLNGTDVDKILNYAYTIYSRGDFAAKVDMALNVLLVIGVVFLFLFLMIWYNNII
ncbi:serine/threonine protein kinase [Caldanaerobius polysaccharolyticus]|uniref:serine/threonine protein kinase n=1 Tax=Caldanaerobius polysaccharolyticus TaxID=44256 RepID=UPI00047CF992|nr:protein kinase [Caldanaerobius polysaccharolyticus]